MYMFCWVLPYFHTYWFYPYSWGLLCWGNHKRDNLGCSVAEGGSFIITLTSHWAPLCLKSPAIPLLFNHFFRRTSKKFTKNSRHWSLRGDWWPADSPHKGPVTREMISFDDVSMYFQEPPSAFSTIGGPHHHGFNWGSRFWHSWTQWTRIMRYCLHGIGNCCDMLFVGNSWNLFQIDS